MPSPDFGGGFSLRLAPGEGNECFAPVESQVGEDVSKTELAVQVAKEVAAGDFPVVLEAKLTFNGRAITMKRTAVLRVGVPTAASF